MKPASANASSFALGRTQPECLRIALVVTCGDEVTHRPRSLQTAHSDDDQEQHHHAHEVEVAFRVRAVGSDPDVTERRPLRKACDVIEDGIREIVELDAEQTLIAIQQERRCRHRERQRRDGEHQAADAQRGQADDDRRDRSDGTCEQEAQQRVEMPMDVGRASGG